MKGFTYIGVLALLAVSLVMSGIAAENTSSVLRMEREAELLFRGKAYRDAIRSYYRDGGTYPRRLEDLLKDPRRLHARHLRRLYEDPMGSAWRIIVASDGGIMGVASESENEPIKTWGFPKEFDSFVEAKKYREWEFLYIPEKPTGVVGKKL